VSEAGLEGFLALLLDHARATRKRLGHESTQTAHLAAALLKREPTLISDVHPAADRAVKEALQQLPKDGTAGDSAEILDLLTRASQAADTRKFLLDELAPLYGAAAPPADDAAATTVTPPPARSTAPSATSSEWRVPGSLSPFVEEVQPADIVGRDAVVGELLALLSRKTPATPLIVGRSGVGRTAVLRALASRLREDDYAGRLRDRRLLRIVPEAVVAARRSVTMREILKSIGTSLKDDAIVCFDDIHRLGALTALDADRDMLGVIGAFVSSRAAPAVITIDSAYRSKLAITDKRFSKETIEVELDELAADHLTQIGRARANELQDYHEVKIPETALEMALTEVRPDAPRSHPAVLIERLDDACARAAARNSSTVEEHDFAWLRESTATRHVDVPTLERALKGSVKGQDDAIATVAARVALTRAKFDLHPERPDGVFLFVGPTGVGKTALAIALATALFDNADALVRLDMSEYAHDWAVSRLVGPQPGYVGYTEPEGWLTTRIREKPHSVLLLDEIEKAHPTVWNTFLQVFDAGRLTDSQGAVAHFSDVIVIMTSNAGSEAFSHYTVGFGPEDARTAPAERVNERIRELLPPELFNRIDETVVFLPLSLETIRAIAESLIDRALSPLIAAGYDVKIDDEARELIVQEGYDEAFGARHLHRNVERTLLQTLVALPPGRYRASVAKGSVAWMHNK